MKFVQKGRSSKSTVTLSNSEAKAFFNEVLSKEEQLTELILREEFTAMDTQSMYDAMLDETYATEIAGIQISPSQIIASKDPIRYRTGLHDYVDFLGKDEYYDEAEEAVYSREDYKDASYQAQTMISDLEDLVDEGKPVSSDDLEEIDLLDYLDDLNIGVFNE